MSTLDNLLFVDRCAGADFNALRRTRVVTARRLSSGYRLNPRCRCAR